MSVRMGTSSGKDQPGASLSLPISGTETTINFPCSDDAALIDNGDW
jgi:hypothetical protein